MSVLILSTSCERDYLKPEQVSSTTLVSFSNEIIPIFVADCNATSCHSTVGGVALDLESGNAYDNLFIHGTVDVAFPETSALYLRMNSTIDPMPPAGKLTQYKVDLVLAWIQQGANDN